MITTVLDTTAVPSSPARWKAASKLASSKGEIRWQPQIQVTLKTLTHLIIWLGKSRREQDTRRISCQVEPPKSSEAQKSLIVSGSMMLLKAQRGLRAKTLPGRCPCFEVETKLSPLKRVLWPSKRQIAVRQFVGFHLRQLRRNPARFADKPMCRQPMQFFVHGVV